MQKISFQSAGYTISGNLFVPPINNPPGLLIVHGAGQSHKEKFAKIQEIALQKGYVSLAIDCTGVGESSGKFEDGSLQVRLQNAQDGLLVLKKYADPTNLSILGSSMGGFIAAVVGCESKTKNILLLAAAAYSPNAEKKKLNEEFTEVIRQPHSWENSRSFALLKEYTGQVLILYGEKDMTIPREIQERYKKIASQKGEWYTIANANHNLLTESTVLNYIGNFLTVSRQGIR